MENKKLEVGQELYSFPTGVVNPFKRKSRKAVELITKQEGFIAIYPTDGYLMWFFDTENHAKICRNILKSKGVEYGNNISRFIVDKNGIPTFDEEYAKENGMM